jgi:hypothetical protein
MLLCHPIDPKAKAGGEKSMLEKREPLEDAEGVVLQDPRDRAKAELPESQSPAVKTHTRCYSVSNAASPGADRSRFADCHLRPGERWVANLLKGMSETPTSCSNVQRQRNAGWPNGREPYGHGVSVVVRGRESRRALNYSEPYPSRREETLGLTSLGRPPYLPPKRHGGTRAWRRSGDKSKSVRWSTARPA